MQGVHGAHNQPQHSETLHALATLSSVAITYAGLAFLYKVIPNARVRVRSALLAAFVAGSAWEVAKFLFAWASGRMVQVHKIYGGLAVLPITLTWIYISWYIALVGCRLCYALDASRKPEPHPAIQGSAARETFFARLIVALAQLQRERGGPIRVQALVREMEVTARLAKEALSALAAGGLAVEARQEDGCCPGTPGGSPWRRSAPWRAPRSGSRPRSRMTSPTPSSGPSRGPRVPPRARWTSPWRVSWAGSRRRPQRRAPLPKADRWGWEKVCVNPPENRASGRLPAAGRVM